MRNTARIFAMASAFALACIFVYYWGSPIGYLGLALGLIAAGRFMWRTVREAGRIPGDQFGGDLPEHVKRRLHAKK